jgi:hypothetical protein
VNRRSGGKSQSADLSSEPHPNGRSVSLACADTRDWITRAATVAGSQVVVSSRCRLVREVRVLLPVRRLVGWLSHGFSLVRASKSRLPAWHDNTEFHEDGAGGTGPGRDGGLRDPNPRRPGRRASNADGCRRSVVRADAIDPVAVAPRCLNWRHPTSGVGRGNILQFVGR